MNLQEILQFWDLGRLIPVIKSLGFWAPLAGFGLAALRPCLPFPLGIPINMANGTLFGIWGGTLISWSGTCVGSAVGFAISRSVGQPVVYRWLKGDRWRKLEQWVRRRGFAAVVIGRLTPAVPYGPFSYVVGLTPMRFKAYFIATMLGSLPSILVGTVAGDLLRNAPGWMWVVVIAALLVGSAVVVRRGQQQFDKALDKAEAATSEKV